MATLCLGLTDLWSLSSVAKKCSHNNDNMIYYRSFCALLVALLIVKSGFWEGKTYPQQATRWFWSPGQPAWYRPECERWVSLSRDETEPPTSQHIRLTGCRQNFSKDSECENLIVTECSICIQVYYFVIATDYKIVVLPYFEWNRFVCTEAYVTSFFCLMFCI